MHDFRELKSVFPDLPCIRNLYLSATHPFHGQNGTLCVFSKKRTVIHYSLWDLVKKFRVEISRATSHAVA